MPVSLECATHCGCPFSGGFPHAALPRFCRFTRRLPPGARGRSATFGWPQLYAGPSGLRKPNGDGLLGRSCTVFALPDVVHLLAYELTRLGRRRFPFPSILSCPLDSLYFWHASSRVTQSGTGSKPKRRQLLLFCLNSGRSS